MKVMVGNYMYVLVSQNTPVYPAKQTHLNMFTSSTHCAPFWQGLLAHSSISACVKSRERVNIFGDIEGESYVKWKAVYKLSCCTRSIFPRMWSWQHTRPDLIWGLHIFVSVFFFTINISLYSVLCILKKLLHNSNYYNHNLYYHYVWKCHS